MFSCFLVCDLYHLMVNATLAGLVTMVYTTAKWSTRIQRTISEAKEESESLHFGHTVD